MVGPSAGGMRVVGGGPLTLRSKPGQAVRAARRRAARAEARGGADAATPRRRRLVARTAEEMKSDAMDFTKAVMVVTCAVAASERGRRTTF